MFHYVIVAQLATGISHFNYFGSCNMKDAVIYNTRYKVLQDRIVERAPVTETGNTRHNPVLTLRLWRLLKAPGPLVITLSDFLKVLLLKYTKI